MSILRWSLTSAILTAILPLAACGGDSLNWTEDVQLPDGRTVTLTRHQEFKGPHELGQPRTTSAYWFEFDVPSTGERVRWENDRTLSTISLSVNDNVPELLTTPNYDGMERYKCPDPPYVGFQFVNKAWVQIPLTRLTHKVLPVNLTSPGSDLREGLTSDSHLSATEVQRVLPYQRRGKVVDLSTVVEQTFEMPCYPPFNFMMRDSGSASAVSGDVGLAADGAAS